MITIVVNALVFHLAWMTNVMAASHGLIWVGPAFTLCWMLIHGLSYPSTRKADLFLCISAAVSGYLLDSLLVLGGMMSFPAQSQFGSPSTLWMVALWVNLALTLNYSLHWLQQRYFIAALLGSITAPLAYLGGSRLGAIYLSDESVSLIAIALIWTLTLPFLVWLASMFEQHHIHPEYRSIVT